MTKSEMDRSPMKETTMQCEIYQVKRGTQKGQWRWRVRSSNGKTMASGESYQRKGTMLRVLGGVLQPMPIVDVTDPRKPSYLSAWPSKRPLS